MATSSGTWSYRNRFGEAFGRTYFRRFGPGVVSSIGLGTYLGDPTDAVDARYETAITIGLENGINHVDTAINYRCQRSERAVGAALRGADVDREEIVVATKGGFLPFDDSRPDEPGSYLTREFVEPGHVDPDDLARGTHCIAPNYIEESLDRSLENLDVDAVDLFYVHNPETQLTVRSREAVYDQLESTFERLEERRLAGDIGRYGVATWKAFRVPATHDSYLSLPEIVSRAEAAAERTGLDDSGLAAIQLPFNVRMADAFTRTNMVSSGTADGETDDSEPVSMDDSDPVSTLHYAHEAGISVFTSASIGQGELANGIPDEIAARLAGETAVQRAINFARSAPGVTGALVGASSPEHVRENVAAGTFDPLGADAFDAVFD